jgi:RNA polymerase sigma-70 factor (family 1)
MGLGLREIGTVSEPQDLDEDARDRAWAERIRHGDEVALAALFRAYYGSLHRCILRTVGSPEAADEVVQDVFMGLWDCRATLHLSVTMRSYLFRAVHNRAITASRRRAARERMEREVAGRSVGRVAPPADTTARHNDCSMSVRAAVDRLPAGCRDVFLLSRRDGLTTAEIAHVLGVSEKAVEMRLWRALRALRRSLAGYLPVPVFLAALASLASLRALIAG